MIWNMYKKELRSYLRNPFQLVFTLGFPLIFVLLMGYTMSNVIGETASVESDEEICVLYMVEETATQEAVLNFEIFQTFAELGFIMFYISLIVGQSVFADKDTKAFRRIYISDASVNGYVAVKVALGITISVVQIVEVYLLSTLALDVSWGENVGLIVLTFLCLGLFSSVMGSVMGVFSKSRADMSDKILIISILVGLLGGGLTPVTFLESYKVLSYICKISPLYWITNGTVSLAGNQSTNEHFIGMAVCLVLSAVILLIYAKKRQEEQEKGVFLYE